MRVLLACPYAWDAPGGVQVHVRQLAGVLLERGHDVLVLAPGSRRADEPFARVVGRPVSVPYAGTVAPICFSRRSFRRIRRFLRVFEPDVVHVHEPFAPSTSMLTAFASAAPIVATHHAHLARSRLMELAAPILRSVQRRIAARIAVSQAAAAFLWRAMPGEVEVIPNGVDLTRFAEPGPPVDGLPGQRRILWVARLDRQKGFPVMVRAFARLAAELDDVSLVVAGDGRDREALGLLSEDDRRRVAMLGTVRHEDLPSYHAAANVFASPALGQESFGITLVEAMAAGLPVVATDIPGYREVVAEAVEGLLVPPGDPTELASALRRVLTDPDLASGLGAAGRRRAEGFSWDVVAPQLEAVYGRVADGAR